MPEKPIRVFWSELSNTFYAANRYKEHKDGIITITGKKHDVTQDIAAAIKKYGITFKVKE
jgi:hypothetical protein